MPARSYLLVSVMGLVAVLSTSRSVDPDFLSPHSGLSPHSAFNQPPLLMVRSLGSPQVIEDDLTSWTYVPYNDQTTVCWNNFNDYIDERDKNNVCTSLPACCDRIYNILQRIQDVEDSTDCDVNETLKQNQQHAVNDRATQCNLYNIYYCAFFGITKHCSCDPGSDDCNST